MEWFLSLIIFTTLLMTSYSEATCNLDQQYSCKRAVREERLDVLPGGGECFEKEYVQFSYLCVVNNYLPSVDYCCCALYSAIFCCRYHQDWNQFRCLHEEDEVTSRSLNETDSQLGGGGGRGSEHPLTRILQLSLPSALLLLVLLLLGLGIIGCCLVTTGVSCCSRRFRNCIFRIKDQKRNCVPKKSLSKFKESRFLQRTPVRDLDSLSGLMHGPPTGISSPDHHLPPAAPVAYEDDPIGIDGYRTEGDVICRPDGQRIVLQPSAPSLAEIMGLQEYDRGGFAGCDGVECNQLPGHPFLPSTPTGSDDAAYWWSSFQRPRHDCRRQDSFIVPLSTAGGLRDAARFDGSPIRCQLCTDQCSSHRSPPSAGAKGGQRPQSIRSTRSQILSANSRH